VKPVKFQSDSEFAKSISTESKVLSIYAVGVVKGYKRETRVKIHAVVDFRGAPSLLGGLGSAAATNSSAFGATGGQAVSGAQQDVSSIAAALQTNVGGAFLYYDIE
jgi:general secretion pathway protein K